MRRITPVLTSELFHYFGNPKQTKVGAAQAFRLETFRELVEHVARLSFANKDHMLFYRGRLMITAIKPGYPLFTRPYTGGEIIFLKTN